MENNELLLYVGTRVSEKGNNYQVMYVDLGYTLKFLTFDKACISEITGLSLRAIGEIPANQKVQVGKIILK